MVGVASSLSYFPPSWTCPFCYLQEICTNIQHIALYLCTKTQSTLKGCCRLLSLWLNMFYSTASLGIPSSKQQFILNNDTFLNDNRSLVCSSGPEGYYWFIPKAESSKTYITLHETSRVEKFPFNQGKTTNKEDSKTEDHCRLQFAVQKNQKLKFCQIAIVQ